jgi:hypothetical protein
VIQAGLSDAWKLRRCFIFRLNGTLPPGFGFIAYTSGSREPGQRILLLLRIACINYEDIGMEFGPHMNQVSSDRPKSSNYLEEKKILYRVAGVSRIPYKDCARYRASGLDRELISQLTEDPTGQAFKTSDERREDHDWTSMCLFPCSQILSDANARSVSSPVGSRPTWLQIFFLLVENNEGVGRVSQASSPQIAAGASAEAGPSVFADCSPWPEP